VVAAPSSRRAVAVAWSGSEQDRRRAVSTPAPVPGRRPLTGAAVAEAEAAEVEVVEVEEVHPTRMAAGE
jgi:hypothetical protein